MKLQGRVEIAAPAEAVWSLLIDPLTLASCVPGVRSAERLDERTFRGEIGLAVGPMSGEFTFTAVITRADYPAALDVTLDGIDSVTKSQLTATVTTDVEAAGGSTSLAYRADIAVKGRLAILGEMVLRATANAMVGQVVRCLKAHLEDGPAPAAAADGAG